MQTAGAWACIATDADMVNDPSRHKTKRRDGKAVATGFSLEAVVYIFFIFGLILLFVELVGVVFDVGAVDIGISPIFRTS